MLTKFFAQTRKWPVIWLTLLFFGAALLLTSWLKSPGLEDIAEQPDKHGGFYIGIYEPEIQTGVVPLRIERVAQKIDAPLSIISYYQAWSPEALPPANILQSINDYGAIPLISWEPWSNAFPIHPAYPELSANRKVFQAITAGFFDSYLDSYAAALRDFDGPVLLRFAHEFDNPAYPWSETGGNSSEEFIAAWRYVHQRFQAQGAANVAWIWHPWDQTHRQQYYPGDDYVDWIGITALNYGLAARDGQWREFQDIYEGYRPVTQLFDKPVILAEFGSTAYGGLRHVWLEKAFQAMAQNFPEIKALVFFNSSEDTNWITDWRPNNESTIHWSMSEQETDWQAIRAGLKQKPFTLAPVILGPAKSKTPSSRAANLQMQGPGSRAWLVAGEPYYMQGVAFNPGHANWRDPKTPLTRKNLQTEFAKIKALGANTIRRYAPTIYDRIILQTAKEFDLKIVYGFWFDESFDYVSNQTYQLAQKADILKKIEKYKDDPSIIAWSLGNETWGLLKHEFSRPYLAQVRRKYLEFLEEITADIRLLDPNRPIIIVDEFSNETAGALDDYADFAPSADILGFNVYYESHLEQLGSLVKRYDGRPYLLTEFGPDGIWENELNKLTAERQLLEPSDLEKAGLYANRWSDYVLAHKDANLGGIAYAWQDRLHGTLTWFGLTDQRGLLKPAYFALQQAWEETEATPDFPDLVIDSPAGHAFLANQEIVFTLRTQNNVPWDNWDIEWLLLDDNLADELKLQSGKTATLTVKTPSIPGAYRLYARLKQADKTTTASFPFIVQ